MQLTPSQRKALDDSRHLAITANAGSGKTRVLVERYIDLFERHDKLTPRNVVAITFTEAAAAELRKRIAESIAARLRDPGLQDPQTRLRLEYLRDGLSNAYISTIHSFAKRLITAYPVEANVDATFTTLPPAERTLIVEETIAKVFRDVLQQAYDSGDEQNSMLHTFRTITRRELTEVVTRLLNSRFRTRKLHDMLDSGSDSDIIEQWRVDIELALLPIFESQTELVQAIYDAIPPKSKSRDEIRTAISDYFAAGSFSSKHSAYSALWKKVFTGDGTVRDAVIKKKAKDQEILRLEASAAAQHKPLESLLRKLSDDAGFYDSHLEYLLHLRNVLTLHDKVEQEYVETKQLYSMLDFDDQIDRLHSIVRRPEIASELATQFQYILIDEYQDTDETQFEIACSLTDNFGQTNKLVIVGDPKQSIYGFRNADVRVFNKTKRRIEEQTLIATANARTLELGLTGAEILGAITLAESFRTADRPLAYVNWLFRELMKNDSSSPDQGDYVPLIAAREGRIQGSVEWLVPRKDASNQEALSEGDNADSDDSGSDNSNSIGTSDPTNESAEVDILQQVDEADLIAQKLLRIIHSDREQYQIYESTNEHEIVARDPTFRDIAILLRTRKPIAALEQALTHYGIPYLISRGTGFFEQQEIIDLISYFNFLLNPRDDVSLIGILRSPMFGLSDTLLYKIHVQNELSGSGTKTKTKSSPSFWHRFSAAATQEATSSPTGTRALTQLEENLKLAGRVDSSVLLEKILDETGILATYSALPGGEQIVANIEKFLAMARTHDSRGLVTLFDFVQRMDDLVKREGDEAQAQTSSEDSVRIMTIHGAKGLEFPIVVAAELGQPFNLSNRFLIDQHFGVLFNKKELPKPAITSLMTMLSERRSLEEEMRVLYVCFTRAKDHLILSGKRPTSNSKNKNSPLKLLNALHNDGLNGVDAIAGEQQTAIGIVETITRYHSSTLTTSEETLTFSIPITHALGDSQRITTKDTPDKPDPVPQTHLETYEAATGLGRFSPSQLLTYIECPTKYYLRYILGVPEDSRLIYELAPDELAESVRNEFAESTDHNLPDGSSRTVRGPMLGQLIHKLFERIDQLHESGTLHLQNFNSQFDLICAGLGIRDAAELQQYRKRALSDIEHFLQSEYGRIVLAAEVTKTEFSVHASLTENDHLRGIIDRFFITHGGEAHILDYKTDRTTGKDNPKKRDRYEFQVKFYAYLVSMLYSEQNQITATVYYTSNGTLEQYKFDRESFRGIEQTLRDQISKVRSLEKVKSLSELPRNLEHCRECAYFEESEGRCVATVAENAAVQYDFAIPN